MKGQKKIYTGLLIALLISPFQHLIAQGPNCRDINPSVMMDESIEFDIEELLTNTPAFPLSIRIENQHKGVVLEETGVMPGQAFDIPACRYLGTTLKAYVTNSESECWSKIIVKGGGAPILMGRSDTLWCTDPAVTDIDAWEEYADDAFGTKTPLAMVPCSGPVASEFAGDWIDPNDTCGQDVAKVIYREYEAFDKNGNRGTTFDTITVFRLPLISATNAECPEVDTMYCGVTAFPRDGGGFYTGPRLYKFNPNTMECDTIWFCYVEDDNEDGWLQDSEWKTTGDLNATKCGLAFKKKVHKFEDSCSPVYKIELEIKQICAGGLGEQGCDPGMNPIDEIAPGYYTCTWWVYDLDTLAPEVECYIGEYETRAWTDPECQAFNADGPFSYNPDAWKRTIVVPAGAHDCEAHTYLPPAIVADDWSGVKTVKARFNGATYIYEADNPTGDQPYGPSLDTFRHHTPVKVPKADWPQMVILEAYDNCHLVAMDTCYILVKDRTRPTAVVDKGITVSIPDKKVWVNADSFDEGSWDNCGDPRIFVRRADWYTSCIDLCTNVKDDQCSEINPDTESALEFCLVGDHKDTLWYARLDDDKHCNEVEAHYSKTMEWLVNDGTACGELLYNAWTYDLIKYGTLECGKMTNIDEKSLDKLIRETMMLNFVGEFPPLAGTLNEAVNEFIDGLRLGKFRIDLPHLHECDYFSPNASAANRVINAVISLLNLGTMDFSEDELDRLLSILNNSADPEPTLEEVEFFLDMIVTTYQQWLQRELDKYSQIGGGWSDQVAFDCSDACQSVTVEVLAIDYWCNWSKGWTDVWVEDKTPVQVVKDVATDFEISCKTYKDQGIDLLVMAAVEGDASAMIALDTLFGGYQKAWRDSHGNYVDVEGEELDHDLTYSDSSCFCTDSIYKIRVQDEHLGYVWKDSIVNICGYRDNPIPLSHGAVVVNCAENVFCSQTVWADFKDCGVGSIHRKFKIWQECVEEDASRSYSGGEVDTLFRHQTIWVGNECDLESGMFDKPEDVVVEQCGIEYDPDLSGNVAGAAHPDSTGRLVYNFDDDCRVVGVGYYDKVFKIVGGDEGCYKILRTWCYSDWCEGKPNSESWWDDPDFATDVNKYVQKIIIVDPTPPVITIDPVTDGAARGSCAFSLSTQANVADACGLIEYAFEIISNDDQSVVASGFGEIDGSDSSSFMINPTTAIPPGDFTIQAMVRDECQNEMMATTPLTVTSDKKPGMVCVTALTAELTPIDTGGTVGIDEGCAIVWADEYRSSITPACSDDSVSLFIERIDGVNDGTLDPEDADSIKFSCDDYDPTAPIMLRLWAVSLPSGSMDYCDIVLTLQNNMQACILSRRDISGTIQNELQSSVEDVDVKGSLANGQSLSFLTSSAGAYRIANVLGIKMNISPTKNTDHLNGISTADLIKIQKHILGKELIESQYRMIAADANADEQINALDLIALRKLILGVTPELEQSDSWRFVNMIDGAPTYEVAGDQAMSVDFTGIKVGDVNLDSDPGRSMARSSEALTFTVVDRDLQAGEVVQVALYGEDLSAYEGFQMTASVADQISLLDVSGSEALGISKEHFGLQKINDGQASVSWNRLAEQGLSAGLPVMTLLLEAKANVRLSEVLTVNSSVTSAEAYVNDIVHGVAIDFVDGANDNRFALLQNQPNPFASETNIGFHLPDALAGSLTVYDVTGKVLMQKDGEFTKGYNQVSLTRTQLSKATGVLYYQLDTEEHTATRKMILLD